MNYDPEKHNRRSLRIKNFDYTRPGAYFVTMCAFNRECIFGGIEDGVMRCNQFGNVVKCEWHKTAEIRKYVELDEFVVMPNHFHGIIWIIDETVGARRRRAPTAASRRTNDRAPMVEQFGKPVAGSLPTIVRSFKSAVTKHINIIRNTLHMPVWQTNYYEHVVRNEDDLNRIRKYVIDNPMKWELDEENPEYEGTATPCPNGHRTPTDKKESTT